MNIVEIIDKKSKKLSLTKEEIDFFVNGLMSGIVKDYHAASLLMAIKINGFTDQETINYATALINSGETLPLKNDFVDKHSSGGIGDKTSIALLPILGAMNVKIFKISGRGLGFTGGTIDKLESIKGFNAELGIEKVYKMVEEIGISLTGQTPNLTPADGKIYSLRDITATVDSIPLIAASIISKKIASGAKNILIDMKIGSGAFMKNIEEGQELARLMKLIANKYNRNLFVLFSSMDQPLGFSVGNKLEVIEAIEFLKGNYSIDFYELVKKISIELHSKSKNVSKEESEKIFEEVIKSGTAFKLQKEWFKRHGVSNYEKGIKFEPKFKKIINSEEEGYVFFKNLKNLGNALIALKAGREFKNEKLDFDSGIKFLKKQGEKINKNEPLFEVTSSKEISEEIIQTILKVFDFTNDPIETKVILGEVKW
ncbi:MAG: pyrimidine-nucleoside phosphorylase [Candidatus Tyloplasma litorale]|nr:MAG: pyrimidine-nucleoside phosphorylase [Mycoplasmatales bacterium]